MKWIDRSWRSAAVAAVLTLMGGCLGDGGVTGPQVIGETEFAASLGIDLSAMTLTGGVYIQDIEIGTGDPLTAGASVEVAYTGWLTNGTVFDPGLQPFTFTLGAGAVIQGFDIGVDGMQLGGKRKIVIPPELGYGSRGAGSIPPGSILIFEVEVLSVG
jgi:FKBP-type peptidyl-prolyl cis-trans isomerase